MTLAKGRLWRRLSYIVAVVAVLATVFAVVERATIRRVLYARTLFTGADQVQNFRRMASIFPVHTLPAAAHPAPFESGSPMSLPETYRYDGQSRSTEQFLKTTDTTGLLVLKDSQVVYEKYWRGVDAGTHWISFSLCKSFVSALVGIAVSEGSIKSIEDPVTQYLPDLRGSAYDGVRIKDILQMSSGASWNEDYSDPSSDINRFAKTFAFGGSFDAFVKTLKKDRAPGTFNRYNSMDTQVLGMLLRRVTHRSLTDYLSEKLWQPLGMDSGAEWIVDDEGSEFAAGGLNATLRDYARLGELYRRQGLWNGKQLVDANWVKASITPDAPHLQPGVRSSSDSGFGYGLQWWVPDNSGAFSGIGIYNQFIYVSADRRIVIAKISANHLYGTTNDEKSYHEEEHIALFHAIEAASEGQSP